MFLTVSGMVGSQINPQSCCLRLALESNFIVCQTVEDNEFFSLQMWVSNIPLLLGNDKQYVGQGL